MSNVVIVSPFRDAAGPQIATYRAQIESQTHSPLRIIAIEGDSTDNTLAELNDWATVDDRVAVIKLDTGQPRYPSIVDSARFAHLASIMNVGIDAAIADGRADYTLFIPSDVIFNRDMITRLLMTQKDIISPMFWIGDHVGDPVQNANGLRFYDIWGFTKDGQAFPPMGPAWFATHFPAEPFEVDTTGGVMLCRADVIRAGIRYTLEEVDRGLCKSARAAGFKVWCDPTTHILHGPR
jgi:hypothetical protein